MKDTREDDDCDPGVQKRPRLEEDDANEALPRDGDDDHNGEERGPGGSTGVPHIDWEAVQGAVEALEELQENITVIEEKAAEEILRVNREAERQKAPHLERRHALTKVIPKFWATCLTNHPLLGEMICETDQEILCFLQRVHVEPLDDGVGFTIKLDFRANPFLTNAQLHKTFHYDDNQHASTTSSEIHWKNKPEPSPGFFAWLEDNEEGDDEVGLVIRDDIWPNPLALYMSVDDDDAN